MTARRLIIAFLVGLFVLSIPTGMVDAEQKGKQSRSKKRGKSSRKAKKSKRATQRVKHVIIPGETLISIAKRYGVEPDHIKRWNKIDGNTIRAGQTLVVHARRRARPRIEQSHTVKRGETFASIAKNYEVDTEDLIAWNRRIDPRRLRPGMSVKIFKLGVAGTSHSSGKANDGRLANAQQLPDGPGYIVRSARRAWGTTNLVNTLMDVFARTKRRYPDAHDIVIGDLSYERGGHMPPHKSHQSGRDVDATYYIKGGLGGKRFRRATPQNLDVPKTWYLFDQFIKTGKIKYIFVDYDLQKVLYEHAKKSGASQKYLDQVFQYPRGRRNPVGIIRWSKGHDDHFHLRVKCRDGDKTCR